MKCAACSANFNDGVQCGVCKRHFDFSCAQIAETSWRKLGAGKRAAWRCPLCRSEASSSLSPAPSPARSPATDVEQDPVTLELVFREIRELKSQLSGLPGLLTDVREIKEELSDLRDSLKFTHEKVDELTDRTSAAEVRLVELERAVSAQQSELAALKLQGSAVEQRLRLNNVEIKGVPWKKDENLFKVLDAVSMSVEFMVEKAQINYIYRVPTHTAKEKSIIVCFLNRYVKEDFVAAARARKSLTAADIGFPNCQQRVFINDHLSGEAKNLLTKCKAKAKERNFTYVWVKFGKIHIRKNDTSPVIIINKECDLNKIA